MKIVTEPAAPVTKVRMAVPPHVAGATAKALEKLPADRFTSARDLATALDNPAFRHGERTADPVVGRHGPWNRLAVTFATLFVTTTLLLVWMLVRPSPPLPVSRFHLTLPEGLQADMSVEFNATVSPDGSRIAFAGTSAGGARELWVRHLDRIRPERVPGTVGAINPRFSPDGESVAFMVGRSIATISLDGGEPFFVVSDSASVVGGLAWGADGMLYFSRVGHGIWRASVSGGEWEAVTALAPGETAHRRAEALPDGSGIIVTRRFEDGSDSISVVSSETGEVRTLVPGAAAKYARSGHLVYTRSERTLLAAPFTLNGLEITGPSRPLLPEVAGFAVSETGVLTYMSARDDERGARRQLEVIPFDGRATSAPVGLGEADSPRWSPDGRTLAYSREDGHIYTYDVETEAAPNQQTFEGVNAFPVWSPDGRRLLFASVREGTLDMDLFAKNVRDDTPAERMLALEGDQIPWQWLDNDDILFQDGGRRGNEIWRFSTSRGGDTTLYLPVEAPFAGIGVTVSPDGRWAAYSSREGAGEAEVYVRGYPVPRQPVAISRAGGVNPRWSADGTAIYYWSESGTGGADTLRVATVVTEPTLRVVAREDVLVGGDLRRFSWDLHPDGDRIVVNAPAVGGTSADYVVVLNFLEELKARVEN
jgi:serine/threonine-protein kinase